MKTNEAITNYLNLLFCNVGWPNVGDVTGILPSGTAGNLYLSLHTAYPGNTGSQTTNEAAYGSYARVPVVRSAAEWTVATPQVTNANTITWPSCTSGSETETHWGIGTDSSGAGHLLYSGVIGSAFNGFTAETSGNITVPVAILVVNDTVTFYAMVSDWTFPTGITQGQVYYVKTVSGDVITVSATLGGTAITISAAGAGSIAQAAPLLVSTGIAPSIPGGGLVLMER